MTIFRSNPILIMLIATVASLALSAFAGAGEGHAGIEKAAFIFASGLFINSLGLAGEFAGMFKPAPQRRATRVDANSLLMVIFAFVALGGAVGWIGVEQFADSAFESLAGAGVGAVVTVATTFAKKDAEV